MKKTLSVLLLVLLTLGLIISCDSDSVEKLFQREETPTVTKYTVTFNMQGHGTQIEPKTDVVSGSTISAPKAPTADGYTFGGWFKEVECTNEWNFSSDTVTADTTLYAKWTQNPPSPVAVTGVSLNKTTLTLTVGSNETLIATITPTDATNKNVTWTSSAESVAIVDNSGKVTAVAAGTATITVKTDDGNKTATCQVIVTAPAPTTYTVTFDMQGHGTQINPINDVASGSKIEPPGAPTAEGFVFRGWFKEASCENQWNFMNYTVTADTTLYAKWAEKTATLTYYANEHGTAPDAVTMKYTEATNAASAITGETGYIFKEWNTNADGSGTSYKAGAQVKAANADPSTMTLYAIWENTYVVTFNLNSISGTAPTAQTIEKDGKVTEPTDPTKGGYTFDGWYKEVACTNEWKFDTDTVTEDTTLYAKWVPEGFVDLGVKNSEDEPLYWAQCNLGASSPTDYGYYYFWGGTIGYTYNDSKWVKAGTTEELSGGFKIENDPHYSTATSTYTKYTSSDSILESSDDAATAENEDWRMPTTDEFVKLAVDCVWIWAPDYNGTGKSGYIVYKAKNDSDKGKAKIGNTWKMWNSTEYVANTGSEPTGYDTSDPHHIFLPAAGLGYGSNLNSAGSAGNYQSRVLSDNIKQNYRLVIASSTIIPNTNYQTWRYYGYSIRPVRGD